jgi:hypothetical protein
MSMLELRQVSKVYGQGAAEVHALNEVSLAVEPGVITCRPRFRASRNPSCRSG